MITFTIGFMNAKITRVCNCVFISSSLAFPKRAFSYISRTHALIILIPEISSCMIALISSNFPCSCNNKGFALHRHMISVPTRKGNAHNTISPNLEFRRHMQNILPNVSIIVLIIPPTNCDTKFCTCVISFVTRVTREPLPK